MVLESDLARRWNTFEKILEWSVLFETLGITQDYQLLFGPCYRHRQSSVIFENFIFAWGCLLDADQIGVV